MSQRPDSLDRMRIASPCHVGWENMTGDDKMRFCNQCNLHVYNISEMTSEQTMSLIAKAEGRVCARLYRRADGTVLTRDCPVGLRALRKRVSRRAGVVLTAILSLFSGIVGQTRPQEGKSASRNGAIKTKRTAVKVEQTMLTGVVMDQVGAVIPGAKITLINEVSNETVKASSSEDGDFKYSNLVAGKYTLEIEAAGFQSHKFIHFEINSSELVRVEATLQFGVDVLMVGVLVDMPQIESTNGTVTIRGDMIKRLPLN